MSVICALAAVAFVGSPLPDADTLYRQLRARYAPMYAKYRGVETTATITNTVHHSKTGELDESSSVVATMRTYFYAKREMTILRYSKNGEAQDPADYEERGDGMPVVPILDAQGPNHYRLEVLRREKLNGAQCIVARVVPRTKSTKHYAGTMWIREQPLEVVRMRGGTSALPMGVDEIVSTLDFDSRDDLLVVRASTTRILVDVPIFFPDRRITSTLRVTRSAGIPR